MAKVCSTFSCGSCGRANIASKELECNTTEHVVIKDTPQGDVSHHATPTTYVADAMEGNLHDGVLKTTVNNKRALVLEDVNVATTELQQQLNYDCDRNTHSEMMALTGEEYLGKLRSGSYDLLWIATPQNHWAKTPSKRLPSHYQSISCKIL